MARAGRKDKGLFLKPDSSGKLVWHVRLTHDGRERRFGAFKNKTKAREFYDKSKSDQKDGHFFPERFQRRGKALASAVITRYLDTLPATDKTPKTIAEETYYGNWWTARLSGISLHGVTSTMLEEAIADLKTAKKAPQTVVHYLKFMRHVFRWAIGKKVIEKSPFASVTLPTVRAGRTRFLSVEEEAALCQAIGPPYDDWIRLAILTGLRKSEQFGLKWADIDLIGGLITLGHTKAGTVQYVHLNAEAKAILNRLTLGSTSVWVFPSENPDTHLDSYNFMYRKFTTALEDAKLEGVTWHTLRHTFASRAAMNGANESTIAALLRHSGTDLVSRYAHLSPSHLLGALEGVSEFGRGKTAEPVKIVVSEKDRTEEGDNLPLQPFSIPTVPETGTAQEGQDDEETQAVERIGRGERI
ncbi:MAG: site-specific integrase [Nitrospira sp.]|nr:site-specific integrase [Nitrospira sp.]